MKIEITREEVDKHFPKELSVLLSEISKFKTYSKYGEASLKYAFSYCIRLIGRPYETDKEFLSSVTGLSLAIYYLPNKCFKKINLPFMPKLFEEKYLERINKFR